MLDDVLITPALADRPCRIPDYAAEARALTDLAGGLAIEPRNVLQKLSDVIVSLCLADSAGVSIIGGNGPDRHFHWPAVSGLWADKAGGTMPVDASPCSVVIARDTPLLFDRPERVFPAAAQDPRIHEILLVPFHVDGRPVGTLWAIAHTPDRRFDAEDARLLTGLARFAATAWQLIGALDEAEAGRGERERLIRERAGEERYRAFVMASADMVYRMSPDWSEMRHMQGRGILADTATVRPNWMDEYILPADRARIGRAIAHAIRTKGIFELEHAVRRADGTPGWTLSRAVPILGDDGGIVEWLGTASDRTGQKAAAERLRESEERLRQFGEHSPDTLWVLDAGGGRLEYLSAAYERMWGEPRERVMDDLAHWHGHIHPDDRAVAAAGVGKLLAGEPHSVEYRIVRPDGEQRWIFDTGFPIRDDSGRIIRLAGVAQDVTARRDAEDRVRDSERRFRMLSEGVPQLVWRAVDYGNCRWVSPQWTGFTGGTDAESHGWGWLDTVHVDDRNAARAAWDRARTTGRFQVDYRLRCHLDGRYRWFTSRATPVHDDDGRLIEWLGTSTDVDDLRRLQGHQQLLLGELQHRVRNSLAVIRSIARRTAATNRDVDEFSMHLEGRLAAFARTQAAVTRDPAGGLDLSAIVIDELMAHLAQEGEQAHVAGPAITLRSKAGETLALAFHELATNAVKYGALSVDGGTVRVSWRVDPADDGTALLVVVWDEAIVGPPIGLPPRRGFGTELLEDTLNYELEADTLLDFRPTGLLCTIILPFNDMIGTMV